MPDDHGIDELAEDITDEQLEWLAEKRSNERNFQAYREIERLIPGFSARIAGMDADTRADFFTLFQKGANDARSDDFNRVSGLLGTWINEDRHKPELKVFDRTPSMMVTDERTGEQRLMEQSAPLLGKNRATRGLPHDIAGALLTSISLDWNDFGTRTKIRNGQEDLNVDYYARVFYDGFNGDPQNLETGFCRSRYLLNAYRAVFTAPSSVVKDDENTPPVKKTKGPNGKCVAVKLGMDGKVTGRSIAYVCAHIWLSLTPATAWTDEYYQVSLPQMYDFLVDYFEAPEAGTQARARVDALLAWWNQQIYPTHSASAATNKTASASRAALRRQRAALEHS
ncbi:hypothetical protein R3P38DRAFT_2937333 [Favolaschia claudopus]|uniref:Uncharacterized protein n=1 Tax=Favolaschia claudopus TaxID=2862362 RepID=A0AAW0BQT0_9AGAR